MSPACDTQVPHLRSFCDGSATFKPCSCAFGTILRLQARVRRVRAARSVSDQAPWPVRFSGGVPLKESDLRRENEALRERISKLSSAALRVSASLDLDTVLHEVVEGARELTRARYGSITTVDDAGHPQNFITAGVAPEVHRRMAGWEDGQRFFPHLRDLPGPLRVRDLPAYVDSLGLSSDLIPVKTFQATPMRHRGALVGHFFLAEKDDGREFTSEDEEILVLFASQAATAIANARTHRDEQQARADMEALVDTSPVGVVVFNARTGQPLSLNREIRRIVEGLRTPGRSVEDLLEVITCRRADGREIALAEFPLAQQFGSAETVRAEQIVLTVPDGRSVTTLVNATPIQGADGTVESVVVTMQDLAPLEELERMRAEFLGMVSHELQVPLTSIKGSTATVLGASEEPNPAEALQFFRIIDQQADHMRGLIRNLLDVGRIETGMLSISTAPAEVAGLVEQARNTFVSGGGRQDLRIDLAPDLPRVTADRQRIVQVLNNLLSNASRHSPPSSPIRIAAARDGVHVAMSVSDEGAGVPPEQLPHLFRKHAGFVGADRKGRGGATGLGLAICKGLVEAHGGRIWAESGGTNQGTRIVFTIPAADEAGDRAATDVAGTGSRSPVEGQHERRVLVVDDDPQALRRVRDTLTAAGYQTLVTGDARQVPHLLRTERPHLVLLDLMLPETDGLALLRRIPELADLPVIIISVYGREETIAKAFEMGADDYIVKPFSPTELTARVRAALRRRTGSEPFTLRDLAIHYEQRTATVDGRRVELTPTEYKVLRLLSVNAGRVLTYDTLLRRVWRERDDHDWRVVRALVRRLRRKLGDDPAKPKYIVTKRGVGYRMARADDV